MRVAVATSSNKGINVGCTNLLGRARKGESAENDKGGKGLLHPYKIKRKRPRLGAAHHKFLVPTTLVAWGLEDVGFGLFVFHPLQHFCLLALVLHIVLQEAKVLGEVG